MYVLYIYCRSRGIYSAENIFISHHTTERIVAISGRDVDLAPLLTSGRGHFFLSLRTIGENYI